MPLWVHETFINATKGYQFGDCEWTEAYTDKIGQLFRSLQKEYGRCASKMYIDRKDGKAVQTGWVFEKVMEYEDNHKFNSKETYTREVWVQVSTVEPKRELVTTVYPKSPFEID